jgi:hypothetical protein
MKDTKPQVLEEFVAPKNTSVLCEDLIVKTPNFISVLDGVTSKTKLEYRGTSGGRFAAETIAEVIKGLPKDIEAREAITQISETLHTEIQNCYPGSPAKNAPGSQLAVYSISRREIWRVGDIQARVNNTLYPIYAPPTDEIVTNYRSALLQALLADGATVEELRENDPSWELMLPILSRQDLFSNLDIEHPLCYGIINGEYVPNRFIYIDEVPQESEVVLATDGYLNCVGDLEYQEGQLKEALAEDPLLINLYKSFRPAPEGGSFDDRAWIRFLTN